MVKKAAATSYIILALLIMYAPILLLVIFSFTNSTIIGFNQWNGFSFELFGKLFANKTIMTALKNTIYVALLSSAIATVLGTIGAIGSYYSSKKMRSMISLTNQISITNAEIVTALSLALLFMLVFNTRNFITLTLGHVVLSTPFVMLSVIPKLKQLNPNIYEAALDLGATPTRALLTVVLPEILPGILSGFILAITLSLDDYIITVFTKSSEFTTLSTYIYDQVRRPLPPELRALTTLLLLIMLCVVCFIAFRKNSMSKESIKK